MHRDFNLFPFRPMEAANERQLPFDPFGLVLRSAHSMLNTIASKPFLTSVDKVLTCLLATTTKICTIAWSRQDHSLSPSHQQHAVFPCDTHAYTQNLQQTWFCGWLYVCTLAAPLIFKAIAFARWVVTHSLADSNFHGHCPGVFIQQHFLWYLMSVQSGTFKSAFGSSRITYSAYQKMSTNRKTHLHAHCY